MRWSDLHGALPQARLLGDGENPEIHAITCDSRQVMPGALFVAVPGVAVIRQKPSKRQQASSAAVVRAAEHFRNESSTSVAPRHFWL